MAIQIPDTNDFDDNTEEVSNNHGLRGELAMDTLDGTRRLTASLSPDGPDNANEDTRAVHTLTVTLEDRRTGEKLECVEQGYLYYGDCPGDHLADEMADGTLVARLVELQAAPSDA